MECSQTWMTANITVTAAACWVLCRDPTVLDTKWLNSVAWEMPRVHMSVQWEMSLLFWIGRGSCYQKGDQTSLKMKSTQRSGGSCPSLPCSGWVSTATGAWSQCKYSNKNNMGDPEKVAQRSIQDWACSPATLGRMNTGCWSLLHRSHSGVQWFLINPFMTFTKSGVKDPL